MSALSFLSLREDEKPWLVPSLLFLTITELKLVMEVIDSNAGWLATIVLSALFVTFFVWMRRRFAIGRYVFGLLTGIMLVFLIPVWGQCAKGRPDVVAVVVAAALFSVLLTASFPCRLYMWVVGVAAALMAVIFWNRVLPYELLIYAVFTLWWLVTLRRVKSPKWNPGLTPALLFFGAATLLPLNAGRYYSLTTEERMALRNQPGVETLFLRTDPDFPRFRMEMFCEPETKTIVVTPHAISDFATFIDPEGDIRQLAMGGETTDHSYYDKGIWYTVVGGDFLSIDISRGEILTRTPCCGTDTFYLHRLPGSGTFYISQAPEREENFVEIRLKDGEIPSVRLAAYEGYEYVPVEDGRLLISAKDFVAWADPETGHPLRLAELNRWGIFNEVTYDQANGVIYAPDGHRGVVHVLEAETLKNLGQFDASPGVRGILLDPANPKRVFSYNYASGEVREHRMPSGKTLRSWTLGPILRALNWDCGHKALLGATSQGGYRIWLNMASSGR